MNKDFVNALNDLALARGLDKMQLIQAFEESLRQAYERNVDDKKRIEVTLDPDSGQLDVVMIRIVVEKVQDPDKEISLADALEQDPDVTLGEEWEDDVDTVSFSRIALQTAKQMITQRMREAERNIVFNEYKDREGEVITAQIARHDNKGNFFVELGRGEAIMPPKEQIPGERLQIGGRT
jgi:transcription termination/antitermination protein NusA